jgi:hypothetical protein
LLAAQIGDYLPFALDVFWYGVPWLMVALAFQLGPEAAPVYSSATPWHSRNWECLLSQGSVQPTNS